MRIRTEQIRALSQAASRSFEDQMVGHLAEFSPPLFKVIKEEQMREVVRFGIVRAGACDLTLRGPIRLYLESMLLFGSDFATDPQYPWAGDILDDDDSEMNRAERLFERIVDYQEKVSGPQAVNTGKALRALSVLAQGSSSDFSGSMRYEMSRIFPQKAKYIGDEALTALVEEGSAEARKYQFPTRGETLVVALMFAFGHGCTHDPLYPWIERTLTDEKIIDSKARAERLEKKAVTWLAHVLASRQDGAQL